MLDKVHKTTINNTHKLVYLATKYPDLTIQELGAMFELSPMDINSAIWMAEDLGMLTIDKETFKYTTQDTPEGYSWGPEVEYLLDALPYVFERLAKEESDLEENYLASWTVGVAPQNLAVALQYLIGMDVLATYEIKDEAADSTYTFYCLAENLDKRWGEKQFKVAKELKASPKKKK